MALVAKPWETWFFASPVMALPFFDLAAAAPRAQEP
jgi:hypothetical protein